MRFVDLYHVVEAAKNISSADVVFESTGHDVYCYSVSEDLSIAMFSKISGDFRNVDFCCIDTVLLYRILRNLRWIKCETSVEIDEVGLSINTNGMYLRIRGNYDCSNAVGIRKLIDIAGCIEKTGSLATLERRKALSICNVASEIGSECVFLRVKGESLTLNSYRASAHMGEISYTFSGCCTPSPKSSACVVNPANLSKVLSCRFLGPIIKVYVRDSSPIVVTGINSEVKFLIADMVVSD